jgi:hypothetical protein
MANGIHGCDCDWCKRSKRLQILFRHMERAGLKRYSHLIHDLFEELECVSMDLDYIKAGLDNQYISVQEVMREFNIPQEKMESFLKKRRTQGENAIKQIQEEEN